MAEKTHILFVDDEKRVLDGLRRMLRSMHTKWNMSFALGGEEALQLMAQQQYHVVVSDMRMPGMSGEQLLTRIKDEYPSTVRLVLSGQADKEEVLKSTGPIHQFIQKPCDADVLKSAISRTVELGNLFTNNRLKSIISGLETLPSLPSHHQDLVSRLEMDDPSPKIVGEAISKDLGMSAKILQLVNSAFFGLRRRVTTPAEAVVLLGIDTVRSLVLTMQVFSQVAKNKESGFSQDALLNHSATVAVNAKKICEIEGMSQSDTETAYLAGLLHDVGKLVIATEMKFEHSEIQKLVKQSGISYYEAELQVLKVSHCEIGGYLLGLWAFEPSIVDAAVYHHNPNHCCADHFSIMTAVHVANALSYMGNEIVEAPDDPEQASDELTLPGISNDYLKRINCYERLHDWVTDCRSAA